jgi:hypothetical protein
MNNILIVTLFFTFGCGGLTKPTYKKYETAAEVTNPSVEAALASYKTNMAAIQTSCSCHTVQGTGIPPSGKLSATDEAANRTVLLSYTGSTSTKLDELLRMTSATKKHGGGTVAVPTKVQIDTWLAAEAKVTP